MLLVQVSDLHLDGSPERHERAARVLSYVAGLTGVAAVLVSGDIADHGLPAEYEEARALLATLPQPVLPCPGNHDVREAYESVLLGRPATGAAVNAAHVVDGVLVAMCDSSRPGRADGLLEDGTLEWLAATLAGHDGPALVCFHHPPVPLHQPLIDSIRLAGPERLAAVLAGAPQVVAVLTGHAHTAAVSTFAGRPLLVAPGVVSTLRLPAEHAGDLDYDQPPAVALHVLEDGRLTTHYRAVLTGGGAGG